MGGQNESSGLAPDAAARAGERGLTFLEVMAALAIVAIALLALETVNTRAIEVGGDAMALRRAKALAYWKMEEIASGSDAGSGGPFDGLPGYEWESAEQDVEVAEGVVLRQVTVSVHYPVMSPREDETTFAPAGEEGGDEPGVVRITALLPPRTSQ